MTYSIMMPSASLSGLNPAETSTLFSSASAMTFFAIFPASLAIMKPMNSVSRAIESFVASSCIVVMNAILWNSIGMVIKFFISPS